MVQITPEEVVYHYQTCDAGCYCSMGRAQVHLLQIKKAQENEIARLRAEEERQERERIALAYRKAREAEFNVPEPTFTEIVRNAMAGFFKAEKPDPEVPIQEPEEEPTPELVRI